MKRYYLLAPLAAIVLAGCTVYRPMAYTPVVTTPAPVAVVPDTTVLGGSSWGLVDSDGDGYSNAIDRYPYNALFH
jgi:hypothetical protein